MGKGIDPVKDINPEAAALIEDLKEQLLIVFLKRLGGKVDIPVAEIDDTGQDLFMFSIDPNHVFHFETRKKS